MNNIDSSVAIKEISHFTPLPMILYIPCNPTIMRRLKEFLNIESYPCRDIWIYSAQTSNENQNSLIRSRKNILMHNDGYTTVAILTDYYGSKSILQLIGTFSLS